MAVFNGSASNIENNKNKVSQISKNDVSQEHYPNVPAVVKFAGEVEQSVNEYSNNTFANAFKKKKSGKYVFADDISPIEHDVKIQLTSDTITDFSNVRLDVLTKKINNIGNIQDVNVPIECTKIDYAGGDSQIILYNKTTDQYGSTQDLEFLPWLVFEQSWDIYKDVIITSDSYVLAEYIKEDNTIETVEVPVYISWEQNDSYVYIYIKADYPAIDGWQLNHSGLCYVNSMVIDLVAEGGGDEEPIEYVANSDGTVDGVKSIYPNMSITADTEDVTISIEYNQDSNMVKDEIKGEIDASVGKLTTIRKIKDFVINQNNINEYVFDRDDDGNNFELRHIEMAVYFVIGTTTKTQAELQIKGKTDKNSEAYLFYRGLTNINQSHDVKRLVMSGTWNLMAGTGASTFYFASNGANTNAFASMALTDGKIKEIKINLNGVPFTKGTRIEVWGY